MCCSDAAMEDIEPRILRRAQIIEARHCADGVEIKCLREGAKYLKGDLWGGGKNFVSDTFTAPGEN